jgi:hypothetical protein
MQIGCGSLHRNRGIRQDNNDILKTCEKNHHSWNLKTGSENEKRKAKQLLTALRSKAKLMQRGVTGDESEE